MQKDENSNPLKPMISYAKLLRLLLWAVCVGLLLSVFLTLGIGKCDTPSLETGGKQMYKEPSQIIRLIIKKNQTLVLSCESGYPSTILNLGNEESITVCRPKELLTN